MSKSQIKKPADSAGRKNSRAGREGEARIGKTKTSELSTTPTLLVIGYGNTLRGDDGVGPRVVDEIAKLNLEGVQTLTCDLLTPELADPISRLARVVFVDAAVDSPREVQLRPLAPADSSQIMAHAADPRTMLALARDVFGHAPQAWWLTIPIENTAIGETLSASAMHGVEIAVRTIRDLARLTPQRGAN